MQKLKRLSVGLLPHRLAIAHTALLLVCSFVIFTAQASAVVRFTNRSLFMLDPTPAATTTYTISFTYNTEDVPTTTVGSIDLLFCFDSLPEDPCDTPAGIDVSNAVLSAQTGEMGFHILSASSNHIILTRTPGAVGATPSSYTFENIHNPNSSEHSFAIRMNDYASTDATGPSINTGGVVGQTASGVTLETQVPPILVFCVAKYVAPDCSSSDGGNYSDLGEVASDTPLTTTSQMAAGTNASGGYVITANGTTMEAGSHVINALTTPTVSAPGNSQFGINLVANSDPYMGNDPDGASTNAVATPDYAIPNEFMFHDGDAVATAPNVSLIRRFTVSYVINTPPDLHAGVYTTTLTYICTGRF